MAKRLQDLLGAPQDNGWISMAELDAIEAAQRGQSPTINNGSLASLAPGQGYIQRTGGPRIDLQAQPPGPQGLQLDYANPLDYMGAKGYRLKGDSTRALLQDGRMVNLAPGDVALRQKQEAAQLDMDLKRADLASKQGGEWHIDSASGMMINKRNGEIKPIGGASGRNGPAPSGYAWGPAGNDGMPTLVAVKGGPADLKAGALAQQKALAASDVDSAVASLRDSYDRLEKGGGITSTNTGLLGNLAASMSSSDLGQLVGKRFGTENQSARNDIAMTRPALLAALMKATGMSAKQMDSNAELKLWLATATDPQLDVESNRRALAAIERKYLGAGQPAGELAAPGGNPTPKRQIEKGTIRNGYLYMGGDPNDQNSWKAAR